MSNVVKAYQQNFCKDEDRVLRNHQNREVCLLLDSEKRAIFGWYTIKQERRLSERSSYHSSVLIILYSFFHVFFKTCHQPNAPGSPWARESASIGKLVTQERKMRKWMNHHYFDTSHMAKNCHRHPCQEGNESSNVLIQA